MNVPAEILIVDDELGMCQLLTDIVADLGYAAVAATSPRRALDMVEPGRFLAGIVDIKMPEMSGMDFLRLAAARDRQLSFVMITGYGNIENAVACMKLGAFDYITKPFQADEIKMALHKVVERRSLIQENSLLKRRIASLSPKAVLIGESPEMRGLKETARQVAATHYKVLITGESGTGKEVLARTIHEQSSRNLMPFVPVQCSLLPEPLLESELFGHRKGAFTGALQDKPGLFEAAEGGSLFLDEIGDIDLAVQGKLLRFLQEQELKRVGDVKTRILDVRLIAATNKNLEDLIQRKEFREDLYYRLKVVALTVPPLRSRKADLPLLARHFADQIRAEIGRPLTLAKSALERLLLHDWPGNIRELRNCLESAAALCREGVIAGDDIDRVLGCQAVGPGGIALPNRPFREAKQAVMRRFEQEFALQILREHQGNLTRAAQAAGMDKKNFWLLLKKHRIDPKRVGGN